MVIVHIRKHFFARSGDDPTHRERHSTVTQSARPIHILQQIVSFPSDLIAMMVEERMVGYRKG